MSEKFEEWLRTACFQPPTKEAYDLAKCSWDAALCLEHKQKYSTFSWGDMRVTVVGKNLEEAFVTDSKGNTWTHEPSDEMVLVPMEPTHYQIQLIFNTLMGELPEAKPDGWWGTSDQVAEAKKFYRELISAAEE